MAIEPEERQLAAIAAGAGTDSDGPVVMLNLHRYKPGGHAIYQRYGRVAFAVLTRVGGTIEWVATPPVTVIGDDQDTYDEIIAVRYPSRAAFLELVADPELQAAAAEHRAHALERAALICVPAA
jgi:hypothetical protein